MFKSQGMSDSRANVRRKPARYAPSNLHQLVRCHEGDVALPIRAVGAATSTTDCLASSTGTTISTTAFNRILNVDTYNHTVTAQCGVRIGNLVAELAAHGLELAGSFEQTERTLGGAIAAPCIGPGIGDQASLLSSQAIGLKVITAAGKVMKIGPTQQNLLNAFRLSYGMLGTIAEATLKVRPLTTFTAKHRRTDIDTFANVTNRLATGDVGIRFSLMPYMNQVYVELRHYDHDSGNVRNTPWRIKDWGESTVLPQVFRSLNKVVPIASLRYPLIDKISTATHGMANSRYLTTGNNSCARNRRRQNLLRSTWCFPATDFALVVKAYSSFCREYFAHHAYRCDMPATGWRIARDNSALLSPSFDESMIALQTSSTIAAGWDDFALALSEFAENWGGIPLFNQTQTVHDRYVPQAYGDRLAFFKKMRERLDPENRLLNTYLARYFR